MNICFSCFKEFEDEYTICPHCGVEYNDKPNSLCDLFPGTILQNRYIIGQSVGQGGFGIVYKAYDTKLENIISIKEFYAGKLAVRTPGKPELQLIKKNVDEFEYRKKRFLAEARYLAKFSSHKNILNAYDYFEENNTAYITMEYISSPTLSSVIKEHNNSGEKITVDEATVWIRDMAVAIDALHKEKIIHRDIAPDNVFIGYDGLVKLYDLGAAKLSNAKEDVIDKIAKPGYTPPEQYADTDNVKPTNDVYALGATMYRCLTGITPVESTNRKKEDTLVEPKGLNPDIPDDINNIVLKAMAIEPHMRFKNMSEFIKALEGNIKVGTPEQEIKLKKRKKNRGIIIALLIIALIIGVCCKYWSNEKEKEYLEDATISIWVPVENENDKNAAFEAIEKDFEENFPSVELNITYVVENEYYEKLDEASKNNELPNVFVSTKASKNVIDKSADLSAIIDSSEWSSYLLRDDFKNSNRKKITLAIEVPVAFAVVNGPVKSSYDNNTFSNITDLGKCNIAFNKTRKDLIKKNFEEEFSSFKKSTTFTSKKPTSPIMLGSTLDIFAMKDTLAGYKWITSYPQFAKKDTVCNSVFSISIGKGNKAQVKASERLVSWMLDDVYQNYLFMSYANSDIYGWVPTNVSVYLEKSKYEKFSGLKEILTDLTCE